jgi:hypothetical protein
MSMLPRAKAFVILLQIALLGTATPAAAWGMRAHAAIDRAALAGLPADGPVFLQGHADFVAELAVLPDLWRLPADPFSKLDEDPNHGWFREQFAFMKSPPRSRHEFLIALLDKQRTATDKTSDDARRTNVRWTGTMPYAIMETYGRLVSGMRWHRRLQAIGADPRHIDQALAFDVIRLGHYIGDGAQPLHASIHSDGWRGDNPRGYTTDRSIHGRFETQFVEMIALTEHDVARGMPVLARQRGDLFETVLAFLDDSAANMERVYQLEQQGAFSNPNSTDARALVHARTGTGAAMLRDLLHRAWLESALPLPQAVPDPLDSANPAYNPETGSAPAH